MKQNGRKPHFGRLLRRLMSEQGLSMPRLASASGVSLATIKRAVREELPRLQERNLSKIAPLLMLSREDLEEAWEAERTGKPWRAPVFRMDRSSLGYGPVYRLGEVRRRRLDSLLIQWREGAGDAAVGPGDQGFCFLVEDDRMSPFYLPGDVVTVTFRPGFGGESSRSFYDGDDCLAEKQLDDGSFDRLLGRVFRGGDRLIVAGARARTPTVVWERADRVRIYPVNHLLRAFEWRHGAAAP